MATVMFITLAIYEYVTSMVIPPTTGIGAILESPCPVVGPSVRVRPSVCPSRNNRDNNIVMALDYFLLALKRVSMKQCIA